MKKNKSSISGIISILEKRKNKITGNHYWNILNLCNVMMRSCLWLRDQFYTIFSSIVLMMGISCKNLEHTHSISGKNQQNQGIETEVKESFQDVNTTLTLSQSFTVGIVSGLSSSLINHPFQVLRARFQNSLDLKAKNPCAPVPPVLTLNPSVLFKGFPATLFSMWSLTVSQALAKKIIDNEADDGIMLKVLPSIFGGFLSAIVTTPLEGAVLRQSKTTGKVATGGNIFETTRLFYQSYGLKRMYAGGFLIGIRTSIVGSAFSVWTPMFAGELENWGVSSPTYSTVLSGVVVGTLFAAISQPPESIRIEQQFSADEKKVFSVGRAVKCLIDTHGIKGLFKGGSYRIPRTAPGIVVNAVVYKTLESYFEERNLDQFM